MITRRLRYLIAVVFIALASQLSLVGQLSDRPDGMRFVPDVEGQIFNLAQTPELIGFNLGDSPDPSDCRHYQGIARYDYQGVPYFFVTRSGNTPEIPWLPNEAACNDSDNELRNGNLIVFRMGSESTVGERLGSNRLRRGIIGELTQPISADAAVAHFTVVEGGLVPGNGAGELTPRVYQHPGGMQIVGNILAVASEASRKKGPFLACLACQAAPNVPEVCDLCNNYQRAATETKIQFFDVSNPENPQIKSEFAPFRMVNDQKEVLANADGLGITPLPNGKYLMVVGSGFPSRAFYLFRSMGTDLATNTDWEFVDAVPNPLPNEEDAHQALQFLRQDNIDGQLYLAGSRGHAIVLGFFTDHDRIDLFKVSGSNENFDPGMVTISVKYNGRRRTPYLSSGGIFDQANLAAAGGFHITPSGELLYYATQHQNSGPGGSVPGGEWRGIDVVRTGSPTLLPTVTVNGPFEVDEGSSVALSGQASHPVAKPWIQVFEGENFESLNWIVDYEDRFRDDYDDLFNFERLFFLGTEILNHKDTARSWKWYAPVGCSIVGIDRNDQGNVDESVLMPGTGSVASTPRLSDALNDGGSVNIDRELDAVEFGNDCQNYYSTPVSLAWDLDINGSFETVSNSPAFSAAVIDGPSQRAIPVQATHPAGGTPGSSLATVTVKNVAPSITQLGLTDSGGNQIGTAVPFVLKGLPVIFSGGFLDPGVLDHQTATINWGDGMTQTNGSFSAFDEAFGDGVGAFGHSHIYQAAGTFTVSADVADDDGGADSEALSVRVLTPEQAVGEMIAMLDAAIATCQNTAVCSSLSHARGALAGYNPNSNSGALKMISAGNRPSARAFLQTAGTWLARAEADGADNLDVLQALVLQVGAAISS